MKNLFTISLIVFLFASFYSFGQTLNGKVTDGHQNPLPNASIYVDSVKIDTKINDEGYFKIKVPKDAKEIKVSAPDFNPVTYPYNGEKSMNFVLLKKGVNKEEE